MNRPTLSTFRAQWPDEAMGICQSDAKVVQYCNDAQERLLMDPMCPDEGWYGGWITMNLTATASNGSAYVTTPREIARLVVLSVCQDPLKIRNGFYEYLKYGAGLQPKTCAVTCNSTFEAYERDNVLTFIDLLSTPQTIRIYPTDVRDAGKRVLLQGLDNNSQTVLTTDPGTGHSAPGEYVVLMFPFSTSVNTYSKLTGIQKDETWGMVQLYQVDPDTAVETALSVMEPTEAAASYRRYLLTSTPCSTLCCSSSGTFTVTAQGRLDFIPVNNETDYLTVPNVPALIEEAMSIRFSRMDSTAANNQSMLHHARALALLNGQLDKYVGKVNTAVSVPLFGSSGRVTSFK
jgi:hypothetical protein